MAKRRFVVGVMGSGADEHTELSEPLGRMLAEEGVDLLTGGGDGVMRAVARAFVSTPGRTGISIGVLPGTSTTAVGWREQSVRFDAEPAADVRPPHGYPNEYVELPIKTHLPSSGGLGCTVGSRNHINVLTPDVVVALP
eukprot:TRINITY_DN3642_c2_g1_i1.p1 TRINITY_DN3642_c2_g1~~TRINITY_DN3642_c2_g1_i1.p1  ORF type:complete len:159 (+),score=30.15 TRINITY_DN3642_c2_g1_i1:62-478(+)